MIARIRTTLMLAALVAAAAPASQAQKMTPDEVVLRNYVLTMPRVEAWAAASIDVANTMKAMSPAERARRKAELEAQAQSESQKDESIAGMASSMEKIPEIRRAFRKAGLTTREAMTLSLALMQAMMYDQLAAGNPDAKIPYNMNPVNLAFVRKNKAALTARMKEVEAANKAAGDEDSDTSSDDPSSGQR